MVNIVIRGCLILQIQRGTSIYSRKVHSESKEVIQVLRYQNGSVKSNQYSIRRNEMNKAETPVSAYILYRLLH